MTAKSGPHSNAYRETGRVLFARRRGDAAWNDVGQAMSPSVDPAPRASALSFAGLRLGHRLGMSAPGAFAGAGLISAAAFPVEAILVFAAPFGANRQAASVKFLRISDLVMKREALSMTRLSH